MNIIYRVKRWYNNQSLDTRNFLIVLTITISLASPFWVIGFFGRVVFENSFFIPDDVFDLVNSPLKNFFFTIASGIHAVFLYSLVLGGLYIFLELIQRLINCPNEEGFDCQFTFGKVEILKALFIIVFIFMIIFIPVGLLYAALKLG